MQKLLHTNTLTHRSFYTQKSSKRCYKGCVKSQFYHRFWRSNLISCERVAPDALQIATLPQFLAVEPHFMRKGCAGRVANRNFTAVFGDRTSLRAKGLRRTRCKSQLYFFFWQSNLISCEGVAPDALQIATFHQFLAIELHFVRKGCAGRFANRNFTAVFGDRTSFRATGLRRTLCKSQLLISFWRSNLISCERVAPDALQIATFHQFLAIEFHCVRKRCAGRVVNHNFVFVDRTSFRAKWLRFVPSRWHFPAP